MKIYDLHSHSNFSDGTLSPEDLVKRAKEFGVEALALTDHDTVAGTASAKQAALSQGIEIISGVEFSCTWENQLIHMVGLNIDEHATSIQLGVQQNSERRHERAQRMHQDLIKHGVDIREQVAHILRDGASPARPHFAQALVEKGVVKDLKRAFKQFLVRGKPGYIPVAWPPLEEVASWILSAGGTPVLAHPARYKFTRTKLIRLIHDMQAVGVHCLEVSTCTTEAHQSKMLADLAREHELMASIGSDFHSPDQPWAALGAAPALPKDLQPVWAAF